MNRKSNKSKQWFETHDITDMRGPVNPSMNYTCGALIEGFESPPCFMMTYNPPFYQALIEGCGFEKTQDMFAFYGNIEMLENVDSKLTYLAAEVLKRFGVETRPMDRSKFRQEMETFLQIYNDSLPSQWGFVPMSNQEIEHLAGGLRHLINPTLTCLAEVDSRPVGLAFALPDYNPTIQKIDGKLFPFGFLRLLRARKTITRCRLINANIRPEFQRWGLILGLFSKILPVAIESGYTEVEFSWVLESNQLSRGSLEKGGARRYKTYRLFDLSW